MINFNYPYRTVEWQHSILMVLLGIVLLLPIDTMHSYAFVNMLKLMSEPMWGLLFLLTGCLRAFALFINGQAPKGSPIARLFGAFVGISVFSLITTTFILSSALFGATFCFVMAIFELRVIYNATRDLKYDFYA